MTSPTIQDQIDTISLSIIRQDVHLSKALTSLTEIIEIQGKSIRGLERLLNQLHDRISQLERGE